MLNTIYPNVFFFLVSGVFFVFFVHILLKDDLKSKLWTGLYWFNFWMHLFNIVVNGYRIAEKLQLY